jgi:ATP-binding protein involved in chromosome partitioning
MVDPRTSVIDERMKAIDKIIAVSSGKGGVGKSLIATTLALTLAKKGCKTGLFDLDFTSPSTHLILGVKDIQPKEDKGIIPAQTHGLQYMSIVYYSGNHATPLRGEDISNALIELLSVTKWEKLDYLVLDMPPGIGDATLDLIRLIKNIEFIIVTTPSQLAFETVKKLTSLLNSLKIPIVGIIENMKMKGSPPTKQQVLGRRLQLLGEIPYDPDVEETIGNAEKLLETTLAEKVLEISSKI